MTVAVLQRPAIAFRKPALGARIDWSHPLTRDLVGYWPINEGGGGVFHDLVRGLVGVQAGTLQRSIGSAEGQLAGWWAINCPAAGTGQHRVNLGTDSALKPASLPISIGLAVMLAGFAIPHQLFGNDSSNTNRAGVNLALTTGAAVELWYGDNTGSHTTNDRRIKTSTTTIAAGKLFSLVGVIRGATDMDIFINGVDGGGSYTGSGGALAYGTTEEARLFDTAGNNSSAVATIFWAGLWARELSVDEAVLLYREPFCHLIHPADRLPFIAPPAAAAAATFMRRMLLGAGT